MSNKFLLNPLYVELDDHFEFQISEIQAIGIKKACIIRLINLFNEVEILNDNQIQKIISDKQITNLKLTELENNNIIIKQNLYKKTISKILRGHIKILLEQKSNKLKIKTIFKFNSKYDGHQIIRLIYSAFNNNISFKLNRVDNNTTIVDFYKDKIHKTFSSNTKYDFYGNDERAVQITRSEGITNYILSKNGINVPKQNLFIDTDVNKILEFTNRIGYPVCIKIDNGFEGINVFPNIINDSEVIRIVRYLKGKKFVIEEYSYGDCYRFYIIGKHIIPGFKVTKPKIIGDGIRSIKEIVDDINKKNNSSIPSNNNYYINLKFEEET